MTSNPVVVDDQGSQARQANQVRKFKLQDMIFHRVTLLFALLVLAALAGILVALTFEAMPAFREFGVSFLWSRVWNVPDERFGALSAIYGTVVTSVIALSIAVPVSFGIALFLTETCPAWLRRPLGTAIELLAGVPSIIYGIWGLFVFAPLFARYVQPYLQAVFGPVPVIGGWFAGPPIGIGILTAGIVLSLMVIPFVASVMRDVFETVPPQLKESAYGIGCTTWEVVTGVVLPYTRVGVVGGIMLGLGRALGETMAVTFVVGNSNRIVGSLFAPGTSIASTLANEFGEADPGLHISALFALGLVLFIITFIVLAISRWLIQRGIAKQGK
ncbi:phosphate ABC transporter permease subunit PstC [Accumulibacter sp.]|uniref:phosphate ABC transporter permease subunit PstC n=1 Tax=Accumulibacter sp. TaxID=2053492 RepID=UPI0025D683F3|nr:phosphate ABC transporter permease subunit PstC [Accumulibacter sp.]MCM8595349.1 phosphate ABC transporter permease subunit PstC [Accumulibacter sp.]MCM8625308.1 phosphate ABC transporter permease subunit PstC [Accumulibacter sp.]MDS4049496.1 phosphate ABC transporter permease subunit PstC [Accumulibacter sp.]